MRGKIFQAIGIPETESNKALERHTDYTRMRIEAMMGAPITAREYRCIVHTCIRTPKGLCREAQANRGGTTGHSPRPWKQGRDFLRAKTFTSPRKNERM